MVQIGDTRHSCRHSERGWQVEGSKTPIFVCGAGDKAWVILDGVWEFGRIESVANVDQEAGRQTAIPAPLPGFVRQILVAEGQRTPKGTPVATIEAMKMEHVLRAPCDGEIGQVLVAEGDQVSEGDLVAFYLPELRAEPQA